MRQISYKKIILVFFILFFAFLLSLVIIKHVSIPKDAKALENQWVLKTSDNKVLKKLPYIFLESLTKEEYQEGLYKIVSQFYIEDSMDKATLVLTQQPNNGFRIFIDGSFITEVGDLEKGRANIWKDCGLFIIPNGLKKGDHEIEIYLYGVDQLSLFSPPYIYDINRAPLKFLLIKFFNSNIAYFIMGITFLMGILFLSLTVISHNEDLNQVLLGLSFLIWTICLLDFVPINNLIIPYLSFKKIVSISFILASILNFIVIYRIINRKIKYKIYFLTLIIITIILLLFPQTLHLFRITSRFAYVLIFMLCLPLFIHPKMLFSNDPSINLLTVGLVGALYFALRFFIYDIIGTPYLALRHVGLYCYFLFIMVYFFMDYFKRNKRIIEESLRADHFYNKSVIDPLTNINNRNILSYINFVEINYTLFICDLDDFKHVNDTYGHDTGDDVLIKVSSIIKESIRDSDYAIRIGGDEFVFILQNCPFDKSESIASNIWDKINKAVIVHGTEYLKFSCSGGGTISDVGEDYKSALKRADTNLYKVKENRKGTYNFSL